MISDQRLSQALQYLAETDAQAAELKADEKRKEYLCKKVRARIFLGASGNNEERKARAEIDGETSAADEESCKATVAYESVRAKRQTAALIVDVWRSVNANRRSGNL